MRKKDAFTLIELLTVIGVIAILAAISFGITSGVYQRQARTKAAAELSAISSALESYRAQYGTYPITSDSQKLLKALANRLTWESDGAGGIEEVDDPLGSNADPRPFLEPTKFDVANFDGSESLGEDDQALIDPWGNEYQYRFSTNGWERFGFVLFSQGPDGSSSAIPDSGIMPDPDPNAGNDPNADNIYAGGQ